MIKRIFKSILRLFISLTLAGIVVLGLPALVARLYAQAHMFTVDEAPRARVAIVFGAGLYRDGSPTPVLGDRVATAAELYFAGKVEKILMSGDNRFEYYNEPGSMRAYALSLGVPEDAIVLDYAGRRTYDTCYRARAIFGVTDAILVTQSFHLPRALITCSGLGLNAAGVSADRRVYYPASHGFWTLREIPATLVAFWEVWVTRPLPVLGNPEPIFSHSNGDGTDLATVKGNRHATQ